MADEITNCSVGFEYYGIEGCQPRLLPCTHTACESCLQMLLRENSVICPRCRKKHNADNGIRTFPLNKYIISQFEDSLSTEKLNEKIDKLRLYFRQCRDNLLSTKKNVDTKYVDYLVQVKNFKNECTRMFDHLVEETEQNRTNFDQTVGSYLMWSYSYFLEDVIARGGVGAFSLCILFYLSTICPSGPPWNEGHRPNGSSRDQCL